MSGDKITINNSTIYFNNSPVATLVDPNVFRKCAPSDREDFVEYLLKCDEEFTPEREK